MASKRPTVTVSRHAITAFEEPRFLIEWEGKYYLTVAVLEYDPQHPELTEAQRDVMGDLEQTLGTTPTVRATSVVTAKLTEWSGANTVGPGVGDGGSGGSGG
jgi:hypothetical protein